VKLGAAAHSLHKAARFDPETCMTQLSEFIDPALERRYPMTKTGTNSLSSSSRKTIGIDPETHMNPLNEFIDPALERRYQLTCSRRIRNGFKALAIIHFCIVIGYMHLIHKNSGFSVPIMTSLVLGCLCWRWATTSSRWTGGVQWSLTIFYLATACGFGGNLYFVDKEYFQKILLEGDNSGSGYNYPALQGVTYARVMTEHLSILIFGRTLVQISMMLQVLCAVSLDFRKCLFVGVTFAIFSITSPLLDSDFDMRSEFQSIPNWSLHMAALSHTIWMSCVAFLFLAATWYSDRDRRCMWFASQMAPEPMCGRYGHLKQIPSEALTGFTSSLPGAGAGTGGGMQMQTENSEMGHEMFHWLADFSVSEEEALSTSQSEKSDSDSQNSDKHIVMMPVDEDTEVFRNMEPMPFSTETSLESFILEKQGTGNKNKRARSCTGSDDAEGSQYLSGSERLCNTAGIERPAILEMCTDPAAGQQDSPSSGVQQHYAAPHETTWERKSYSGAACPPSSHQDAARLCQGRDDAHIQG